jgi:hypothetical protein
VPEGTAKLAVSDARHAGVFLHFHRVANRSVLDLAQLRGADFASRAPVAGYAQFRRTQQTTDVIRPKRRLFVFCHTVSLRLLRRFIIQNQFSDKVETITAKQLL